MCSTENMWGLSKIHLISEFDVISEPYHLKTTKVEVTKWILKIISSLLCDYTNL